MNYHRRGNLICRRKVDWTASTRKLRRGSILHRATQNSFLKKKVLSWDFLTSSPVGSIDGARETKALNERCAIASPENVKTGKIVFLKYEKGRRKLSVVVLHLSPSTWIACESTVKTRRRKKKKFWNARKSEVESNKARPWSEGDASKCFETCESRLQKSQPLVNLIKQKTRFEERQSRRSKS